MNQKPKLRMHPRGVLARMLDRFCDLKDIQVFCFDLGIEYENLDQGGLSIKIRSFIAAMCKRGRSADLFAYLLRFRPDIFWNEVTWDQVCSLENESDIVPKYVITVLDGDYDKFDEAQMEQVRQHLAGLAKTSIENVLIVNVDEGSIIISFLLPETLTHDLGLAYLQGSIKSLSHYPLKHLFVEELSLYDVDIESVDLHKINLLDINLNDAIPIGARLIKPKLANSPKNRLKRFNNQHSKSNVATDTLEITFLGTFKATLDGQGVKFRSANVRGLLVYLAMQGNRPVPREILASLFWPDETDRISRVNLRQAIFQLRKSLGDTANNNPPFLLVDRQSVQLNPNANIQLDVSRFLTAVEQDDLEAAGILFAGNLLPGFICDSSKFEHWISHEREKLNRIAIDVLTQLTDTNLAKADFAAAKSNALKQLELEPWRERAHIKLMQALALAGEREAAIEQFHKLENILEKELGISPQQETFDLIRHIENNEFDISLSLASNQLPSPFQAPAVPKYFVGRDNELEILSNLLTIEDKHKEIIALVGIGGIGKTTLAAAVARNLKDHFSDGILWGNTLLSTAENILEMWAQAYGRDFSNITDLESLAAAVRGLLVHKKILIVLDNVTPNTDLSPLLQKGFDCAILITTRSHDAATAIGAEILPIGVLSSQSSSHLIERILDQKNLFEDEADQKAVKEIGDMLEHLPLAVEITAQLLKARPQITLQNMVKRLQDATQRRGLKINKKSVRYSFELSWNMLSDELQTLSSIISIFEGRSFTFEALQSIVETDQFTTEDNLYTLVSLSLVQLNGENRFKQHPLVAGFAAEKLGDDRLVFLAKLVDYYVKYSKVNALNFEMLQPEWTNLLVAFKHLSELHEWEKLLELTDILDESWFPFVRYGNINSTNTHVATIKRLDEVA